jgi:myo-inositol-1(or 4)-monophosphatase
MNITSPNLSQFKESCKCAMLAASEVLWKYFGATKSELEVIVKQDQSVRTRADLESEQVIQVELTPYLKNCSLLSEEAGMRDGVSSDYLILVDPLDGTSNYYRGRESFGISIALISTATEHPQTIVVSTYEPSTKRLWSAIRGQGCSLEVVGVSPPKQVHVSSLSPEKGDLCYDASTTPRDVLRSREHKAEIISRVLPTYKHFRMLGSNVLAHALVANGSFEAAVTDTVGGPFDIAGHLLVEEAGGMVSNLLGAPINVLTEKVVITSNGIGHDRLVAALRQQYAVTPTS